MDHYNGHPTHSPDGYEYSYAWEPHPTIAGDRVVANPERFPPMYKFAGGVFGSVAEIENYKRWLGQRADSAEAERQAWLAERWDGAIPAVEALRDPDLCAYIYQRVVRLPSGHQTAVRKVLSGSNPEINRVLQKGSENPNHDPDGYQGEHRATVDAALAG